MPSRIKLKRRFGQGFDAGVVREWGDNSRLPTLTAPTSFDNAYERGTRMMCVFTYLPLRREREGPSETGLLVRAMEDRDFGCSWLQLK